MNIKDRLLSGWNAFMGRDPTPKTIPTAVSMYSYGRPDHIYLRRGTERTIVNAILNRIAVDAASLNVQHVNLDERGRYKEPRLSLLNECLTVAANNDQSARAFIQDAVMSLLDEGVIAIVPTRATDNPVHTSSYDIGALRIGRIVKWYPYDVTVNIYKEDTGEREDRTFPKHMVAIAENPFFATMNEPSSTYQRLLMKVRQLDKIDDQSSSGKMDLILQLPYSTKSSFRQQQARQRQEEVDSQLNHSHYGIAYIDANERVIQLNRAVENNLFTQVEYYTNRLFAELGMPLSVFDGTASEAELNNYNTRIIEPILAAIVDAMKWKFLTKSARTKGQSIMMFREPFKTAPVTDIANNADKFIRNEILTKNEMRQIIGFRPSDDPSADKLSNPNMPVQDEEPVAEEELKEEKEPNKL